MKINNKKMYKAILISVFISTNILILMGISSTFEYLNSGADRTNMLHLEKAIKSSYQPKVIWTNTNNPAREINDQIKTNIELDYLSAWHIKNLSLANNTTKGLKDYYTKNAKQNIEKIVAYNKQNNVHTETVTLAHNIDLKLFSEDGQQAVFTDNNVISFEKYYEGETLITTVKDTASYHVLMLLEDGFWRIRHIEKRLKIELEISIPKASKNYTVSNKKILKNNKPYTIKGINYYPKDSAWDTFGENFNITTLNDDFLIIKSAGLNTIRIFIQFDDFGKSEVSPEKLEKLKQLLDTAAKNQLSCIVTLFDFYGDYSLNSWTITHRHAEKIISNFKDHPAILAWDIKNEPNLDFASRGKQTVIDWLQEMILVVKQNDPNHLVTIGWSNTQSATILDQQVDFVSYHYYEALDDFVTNIKALDQSTSKPIVLQEFGVSSYRGIWNITGYAESGQAEFHKKMQELFKKNNLAFVSWTLYDFDNVPDAVVGKWPWQKSKQTQFGFIKTNGKLKPAFSYISY